MSAASLKSIGSLVPLPTREPDERTVPSAEEGLGLVRVVAESDDGVWLVQRGGQAAAQEKAQLDAAVDPALIRACLESGARVVVERAPGTLTIVGALAIERPVVIDRSGRVDVHARRVTFRADEQVLLRSAGAFLQLRFQDAELYGQRVVSRARELCRVLGRMVKIN